MARSGLLAGLRGVPRKISLPGTAQGVVSMPCACRAEWGLQMVSQAGCFCLVTNMS